MIKILPPDAQVYIHAFGRAVKVTAIFTDQEEVGKFLMENPTQSVIEVHEPFIFLAEYDDLGKKVNAIFKD